MPQVSVVMVFHRDTPFLRPAIESVLRQSWTDLELVLVDNGTGMPTADLGSLGSDARLRWVRLGRNQGIPAGHNAGVAAATGSFIALLDHDDCALPERIRLQVARLQAEPRLGLVSCRVNAIDARDRVLGPEFSLERERDQRAYSAFAAPVVTPAYLGRREVFQELPYRDRFPLAADFDFLARAAERWPMAGVPDVLLHYRRHAEQATESHAAAIEDQRGWVRRATALRRAGRTEELPESDGGETLRPESAAQASRHWAVRFRQEGFGALSAFQARRSLALDRSAGSWVQALRLGMQAVASARGEERVLARRLFLAGPVRALGLEVARRPSSRGRTAG